MKETIDLLGKILTNIFKESVFFRKLFFLFFVTSLILFRTLLNRQQWMNPLSDVMGGWGIWETVNGEQKLTTEGIENVIMMVPFSAVVMWTFEEKIGNDWQIDVLCSDEGKSNKTACQSSGRMVFFS